MKTKLNYTINNKKEEKPAVTTDVTTDEVSNDVSKSRTKLSMQATVTRALGNKLPTSPAQAQVAANPNGWGRNQ